MVSQLKVNEIIKQSGSTLTIGQDGDTVSGPFTNIPYWYADLIGGEQSSVSRATATKVTAWGNVNQSSDNAFDASAGRFTVPSGKAGTYSMFGAIDGYFFDAGNDGNRVYAAIYLNGSLKTATNFQFSSASLTRTVPVSTYTATLSAGDYVELFGYVEDSSASGTLKFQGGTTFMGHRLIGA